MNLEKQEYRLRIAQQLGYRFSEAFVISPTAYSESPLFWDHQGAAAAPQAYCNLSDLPDWTGEMDAAWSLAEEMHAGGLDCLLASPADNGSQWLARFWNETWTIQEAADTAQLAICKVWLKWRLELNAENAIG